MSNVRYLRPFALYPKYNVRCTMYDVRRTMHELEPNESRVIIHLKQQDFSTALRFGRNDILWFVETPLFKDLYRQELIRGNLGGPNTCLPGCSFSEGGIPHPYT